MEKKRIILLIPDLRAGGAERVVSNLSRRFPASIKPYIALHDASGIDYEYKGELIDLGIRFRRDLHLLSGIFRGGVRLRKIKEEHDIETTVSFLSQSHHINLLSNFLKSSDDKIILSVRNFQSRKFKKSLYGYFAKCFIRLFYEKADTIVSISEGVKHDLIDNFGIAEDKIRTIYNPCDQKKITTLSEEKLTDPSHNSIFEDQGPVLINMGSLNEQKGQWHLIRAFKAVKKKIPSSKLVFLGDGELKTYLTDLSKKLDLEPSVFFLGYQKNPFKFLARSDAFVLSSLFEGFGNVLTEAMACGLPIISTDCNYGPREILAPDTDIERKTKDIENGKFGILTPVCDGDRYGPLEQLTKEEEYLKKAMNKILIDRELKRKYEKRSLKRVEDFKVDKIIDQWVEVL